MPSVENKNKLVIRALEMEEDSTLQFRVFRWRIGAVVA